MELDTPKDKEWLLYLASETYIQLKYICHKRKGTTLDVVIPNRGSIYLPFIIRNKPVNIEYVYRFKV